MLSDEIQRNSAIYIPSRRPASNVEIVWVDFPHKTQTLEFLSLSGTI